jgi:hypothetical protein
MLHRLQSHPGAVSPLPSQFSGVSSNSCLCRFSGVGAIGSWFRGVVPVIIIGGVGRARQPQGKRALVLCDGSRGVVTGLAHMSWALSKPALRVIALIRQWAHFLPAGGSHIRISCPEQPDGFLFWTVV